MIPKNSMAEENKTPLVSIIIPVYNKAEFVSETIASALAQSYKAIEIVLVDDGSTDGSLHILQEFATQYPDKIILIEQKNKGVSPATNAGIKAASGDYLQFLDADDLLSPQKIEKQVDLLKNQGKLVMASCKWLTFGDNLENHQNWNLIVFKEYPNPIELLLDLYNGGEMMQPGVYLCSKELMEKAGAWNEKLTINQDGEFFMRVLLQADQVFFEPTGKVYYRKPGEANVSQQKSYQAAASLLESYRCYEREILKAENSKRVRDATAKNYLRFSYVVYPNYPDLLLESQKDFERVGDKSVRIGGPKFQMITKLFGFKIALKLKRFFQ